MKANNQTDFPPDAPLRFTLVGVSWLTSLFASAIATFGIAGVLVALLVCCGWFRVSRSDSPRSTFVTIALGVILLLFCILLLLPAIGSAQSASRRVQCKNHVKFITIAILAFAEDKGHLPPPYVADADGKPMHSWRVLLLPYLDEKKLYDRYRFDEPWDGPNNSKLIPEMPYVYGCPTHAKYMDGLCHYAALLGKDSAWRLDPPLTVEDFPAGSANTVAVCEVIEGIPWTKPDDITPEAFVRQAKKYAQNPKAGGHFHETFFTWSGGWVNLGFADGHISTMVIPQEAGLVTALASSTQKVNLDDYKAAAKPTVKWGRVVSLVSFVVISLLPGTRLLRPTASESVI